LNTHYKNAGVDVEAGYESVNLIKKHVAKTMSNAVLGGLGGFGGAFDISSLKLKEPVLVSGTDGVGTKLKLAFIMNRHDTIGQDCVAMCVNDIVCGGAKPLFFLDYLAVGKNYPNKVEQIVKGVADGCVIAGCSLIGGETAEMPGFYPEDEYDLAGFAVGAVEKSKIITGEKVKPGQTLIGIKSSGVHSNGFSLVRSIFGIFDDSALNRINQYSEELGAKICDVLLTPTKIYVKEVLNLIDNCDISAISHITGGGFIENIPRMLPNGMTAKIDTSKVQIHPIFNMISRLGNVPKNEMYNTFNMGVGMVIATSQPDAALKILGDSAYEIGEVVAGDDGIILL
jgi:phosphoribosylformylglycinamidine cyclo-ligase